MPRSSGGGSHSGGYSSSSSSSSSRSYGSSGGGSHSGGYSSYSGRSSSYSSSSYYRDSGSGSYSSRSSYIPVPTAKVSKDDFTGAMKYVYYKDNKPQYYYSDYETNTVKKHRRLKFWIPFLIFMIIAIVASLKPTALSMDYDNDVYISDTLGIIDDKDDLFDALQAFRDETGITPFVVTVSNESWNTYYDDLYSLAFDVYVNNCEDEKHWVLVYSEPENPDPSFNDWYWEGVQGDDTVYILTEDAAYEFGFTLQKYLTNNRYSVGEAFTMAFNELTPEIMSKAKADSDGILGAIVVMAILLWIAIKRTGIFTKAPKRPLTMPAGAVAVKARAKEINCEYCGGVYLTDSLNCPHCGAGRKAVN